MDGVRGKRETKRIGNGMAGVRACGGGGGGGTMHRAWSFFFFFSLPLFVSFFFFSHPFFSFFGGHYYGRDILFYFTFSLLSSRFVLLVFARSFGFFVLCRFPSKNKSFFVMNWRRFETI